MSILYNAFHICSFISIPFANIWSRTLLIYTVKKMSNLISLTAIIGPNLFPTLAFINAEDWYVWNIPFPTLSPIQWLSKDSHIFTFALLNTPPHTSSPHSVQKSEQGMSPWHFVPSDYWTGPVNGEQNIRGKNGMRWANLSPSLIPTCKVFKGYWSPSVSAQFLATAFSVSSVW